MIALFLCRCGERYPARAKERHGKEMYRRQPPKPRLVGTFFGKVRYWRTYLEQVNGQRRGGFFSLDTKLGLTADGFSLGVLSRAAQLATRMSFGAATLIFSRFALWSPSHKTIEKAVLGLGRYAGAWAEHRPRPKGDGDVLVLQIDSKATPTAKDSELAQRREKRRPNRFPDSARHRGRTQRRERGSKPRRKKGDKSKNGKIATLVVMYTLKQEVGSDGVRRLNGPLNRWQYASYAPKRHAFAIARREADKRGFSVGSGKRIQLMTDGDTDLAIYAKEFFAEAKHSLDVMHVIEYLFAAGGCLFEEGSTPLRDFVENLRDLLYDGKPQAIVDILRPRVPDATTKGKKKTLARVINYIEKRLHMMDYDQLAHEDLELASGVVEGAIRHVIAQRFDQGGMRWIKERAEALLQLRCIELNGEWDLFQDFTQARIARKQRQSRRQIRLCTSTPDPLPTLRIRK